MIRLAINGAAGRMGKRIVALAQESDGFEVAGAMECEGHPEIGADVGVIAGLGELGVKVTAGPVGKCDVMIDFSGPDATMALAEHCRIKKVPLVVGTTGLSEVQRAKLAEVGKDTAILVGANMSLAMNLLFNLVGEVAGALDDSYDVEISETHHRFKRDAPSGTALELARRVAASKNWPLPDCLVHGREGKEVLREGKTIGMHALRAGDTIGEHSVFFAALGETLELKHTAHTRDTFVRGALAAAEWLAGRPAGVYSMNDVLGL